MTFQMISGCVIFALPVVAFVVMCWLDLTDKERQL